MIPREARASLLALAEFYPVVAMTGPRQSEVAVFFTLVFASRDLSLSVDDFTDLGGHGADVGFVPHHQPTAGFF